MPSYLQIVGLLATLGGLAITSVSRADVVTKAGQLVVVDKGNLFSEAGVSKAKDEFARLQSKTGRQVMVETIRELPEAEAASYAKLDQKDTAALRRFWRAFAGSMAKTDQAHGVYILICRKPGYVEVLADKEMRNKGFDAEKERQLAGGLLKAMRDSAKEKAEADQLAAHDKALMSAVEFLERNLPAASADVKPTPRSGTNTGNRQPAATDGEGWGIGGWICLGIAVILGIWLTIALFRMFSGGGMSGGGGGGGFGGGGFFPSLIGGMFGAAAGMWMYDQFFSGHSSHGGDYGGGGNTGDAGTVDDAGAGDFSGDAGSGGSIDDGGGGDFGGGDFGGGGGDFGGGDF